MSKHCKKGRFILIELLAVITIIAILATVLFPVFAGSCSLTAPLDSRYYCSNCGIRFVHDTSNEHGFIENADKSTFRRKYFYTDRQFSPLLHLIQ